MQRSLPQSHGKILHQQQGNRQRKKKGMVPATESRATGSIWNTQKIEFVNVGAYIRHTSKKTYTRGFIWVCIKSIATLRELRIIVYSSVDFLRGWTIDCKKIPKYNELESDNFVEPVDILLASSLLKKSGDWTVMSETSNKKSNRRLVSWSLSCKC